MLNSSKVLKYVKTELGYPYSLIELDDTEILEHIEEFTIPEFSHYFPDKTTTSVNLAVTTNKVSGKSNEYYITDDLNLEIYSVIDIYYSGSENYMFGHPVFGPMGLSDVASWALDTEVAGMIKKFSSFNRTFEFKHPNILRISPAPTNINYITVEYERCQPTDFSKIPNDLSPIFLELCLSDIMIVLGRIRSKYATGETIKTPYGEIPIQANILDEGRDKKREILEKLTIGSMPNVIVNFG